MNNLKGSIQSSCVKPHLMFCPLSPYYIYLFNFLGFGGVADYDSVSCVLRVGSRK